MYGSYEDGIRQTYFDVVAKGADPGRKEEFVSIIRKVLTDTVENGIDPKALEQESIIWNSAIEKLTFLLTRRD